MSVRVGGVLAALLCCAGLSAPAGVVASEGADPVVEAWPYWPYPTSCASDPFDPVALFSSPAEAELGPLPSEAALVELRANPSAFWGIALPLHGWRLASENTQSATFLNGSPEGELRHVIVQNVGGDWKPAGLGSCKPTSFVQGTYAITWGLAADQPGLRPSTRRLRVDLGSGPCSGGLSQNARARKPIFRQLGKKLLMTIVLNPLPPGPKTCQGVVEPPLSVKLPGRLGARELFDGATYPPLSAAETRPPVR